MKLTDWIPPLAAELHIDGMLVHLKAQQHAYRVGITWGMEIPAADVAILEAHIREWHSKASANHKARKTTK